MEITIKCTECGATVELLQKEGSPWLNLRPDYNDADITVDGIGIDNLEIEEDMNVGDDVPAELRNIELKCTKCGHRVSIEF